MNIDFSEFLPDPDEEEKSKLSPEPVLDRLAETINSKYQERIIAIVTSTTKVVEENKEILSFTFYLQFKRHDNFTYPLFTVECVNNNGSFPVRVQSHYGPPTSYGEISKPVDFESVIEQILKEERTRNIILSMY
jgi:hypothetical protein